MLNISLVVEMPEFIHQALIRYLEAHPNLDQNQAIASGLSLFLLKSGDEEDSRQIARFYLDSNFRKND